MYYYIGDAPSCPIGLQNSFGAYPELTNKRTIPHIAQHISVITEEAVFL